MPTPASTPLTFRVLAALAFAESSAFLFFATGAQLSTWFNDLAFFFIAIMLLPFGAFGATLVGYTFSPRIWDHGWEARLVTLLLIPGVPMLFRHIY